MKRRLLASQERQAALAGAVHLIRRRRRERWLAEGDDGARRAPRAARDEPQGADGLADQAAPPAPHAAAAAAPTRGLLSRRHAALAGDALSEELAARAADQARRDAARDAAAPRRDCLVRGEQA